MAATGYLKYLAFCLLAARLAAQSTIDGRVVDPGGLPVQKAAVQLRHLLSGAQVRRESNDGGGFAFENLPPGRYSLSASAESLAAYESVVEIGKDQSLKLGDLRLALTGVSHQVTVVSGSRLQELQEESPVKVEALTREQMRDTGHERVSDILSELPGVVTRRTSTATVGGEQIQGVDSRQVLVLQDGLPIVGARGIKSGALNLNRQDVGKLERVEVVKGAASSLYGSDAIGGVINMITREPSAPIEGGVSLSGGTLGAVDARVDLGARWKKLSFFTDLESHRQDDYGLLPRDATTVGPNFQRNDVLGKLRYAFNERAAIGISATAYHNHETGQNANQTGLTRNTSNDSMQAYALTGDFLLSNTATLQTRAYAARYDENSDINTVGSTAPTFGFANLNERYHRLDATLSQQLGSRQLLQGGVEWAQNLYRGANRLVGDNAGQQVTTNDVWLQDRIQPWKRMTLTLGGRYTHHSLFGDYLVPKAGLVVRLTERLVVRGSFGKGFRAPDLGQLYFRFANPANFYQVIGNPTLRPETSASFSTGIQYRAARYRVGLSLYRNNINNLIDTYIAGTPQTAEAAAALLNTYGIPANFNPLLNRVTYIYLNLGRAYTQGFELDGEVAISRRVRVQGAYTFLNAVDASSHLGLPQRHRHQGYVKTEYSNPRWGLLANVRGSLFSRWLLNPATGTFGYGYQIWDFYASKKLAHGSQFFAAIDNLAGSRDRKLSNPTPSFDRPDYGRTFRVGLRAQFGRKE